MDLSPNGHKRIAFVLTSPDFIPTRQVAIDGKVLPSADATDAMLEGHLKALDAWIESEDTDGQD
jgi:hypothetical protein